MSEESDLRLGAKMKRKNVPQKTTQRKKSEFSTIQLIDETGECKQRRLLRREVQDNVLYLSVQN